MPHTLNNVSSLQLKNNQKVRDRQLAAPKESETLQSLLEDESKLKPKDRNASEGLLWLVRYSKSIPF